ERDPLGLAHLTLLPIIALGLTFAAARFTASRGVAAALLVGCAIDFTFGVFLQARMEHLENTPEQMVFASPPGPGARSELSAFAWDNWMRKHQYRLAGDWGRQMEGDQMRGRLEELLAEDERLWHGWYRRHAGEVEFFGDHFGTGPAGSLALVAMF